VPERLASAIRGWSDDVWEYVSIAVLTG
jgi:hypothetical protein